MKIFLTVNEMTNTEINLANYDFKFAFGLDVRDMADFDFKNNPYIEVKGYVWHVSEGLQRYIDVEVCPETYVEQLIPKAMLPYYPVPLCLMDEDAFVMRSNYETSSNALHFGYWVFYCLNTTENGDWCKSKDEVDAWLRERNSAFFYEETKVNKNLWSDSPQFTEEDEYFPIGKSFRTFNFFPIDVEKSKQGKGFNLDMYYFS